MNSKNIHKNRPWYRGIFFRTTVFSWASIVFTVIILLVSIIPLYRSTMVERMKYEAKDIANSIGQVAANAIILEDYSFVVDHCLKVVNQSHSIMYIVITKKDGFSLIHTSESWHEDHLAGVWNPDFNSYQESQFLESPFVHESVFNFSVPLKYSNINYGWIHVGLSLRDYKQNHHRLHLRALFLAIFCIISGLAASVFFARKITRPIRKLNSTIHKIASGDFSARIDLNTGDELENLAFSFNKMAETLQASQENLLTSQQYTRNIISSMTDALVVLSTTGEIQVVNDAVCNLLGYTQDELIGQSAGILFVNKNDFSSTKIVQQIEENNATYRENEFEAKDGTPISVHLTDAVLRDEFGNVVGVLFVAKDLRAVKSKESLLRKRLEFIEMTRAISSEFINLDSEAIDEAIEDALSVTSKYVNAKSGVVYLFSDNRKKLSLAHQWCSPGFKGMPKSIRNLHIFDYEQQLGQFLNGRIYKSRNEDLKISTLGKLVSPILKALQINSFIAFQMTVSDKMLGFIAFLKQNNDEHWSDEDQKAVEMIGEILSNAIYRKRTAAALLQSQDELELRVEQRTAELAQTNEQLQKEIAEREIIEEKLELTQFSVDNSNLTEIWTDSHGDFIYVNKMACQMLQYTQEELLKMCIGDIDPGIPMDKWEHYWKNLERKKYFNVESILIRKDGIHFPVDITTNFIKFKGRAYNCVQIRDISEIKKTDEALHAYAAELENRNRELQDFAYVASHDLQEPLRKVQAFGDRLKAKNGHLLTEKGLDYLERMQNAAHRMQLLIDGLLTYSRINTRFNAHEQIDLNEVIKEVISDLEVRIEDVHGKIEIDGMPRIVAEPLQMRMLFQNLIGNALKFHKPEESPVIKIHSEIVEDASPEPGRKEKPQKCKISIIDNGIGFDEKFNNRIFGIFQRLHGRQEYEGSGIGLAVCRRIVERHSGKIVAEGHPGEGAVFTISLPIEQEVGDTE